MNPVQESERIISDEMSDLETRQEDRINKIKGNIFPGEDWKQKLMRQKLEKDFKDLTTLIALHNANPGSALFGLRRYKADNRGSGGRLWGGKRRYKKSSRRKTRRTLRKRRKTKRNP